MRHRSCGRLHLQNGQRGTTSTRTVSSPIPADRCPDRLLFDGGTHEPTSHPCLRLRFARQIRVLACNRPSRGKTVGLIECDVTDAEGRLMPRASSTCLVLSGSMAQGR